MTVSHLDVSLEGGINAVATLGSLQIDVRHIGALAHGFPKHVALIVADVDAVNMVARILTLEVGVAFLYRHGVLRHDVLR